MSTVGNNKVRTALWTLFVVVVLVILIDAGSCSIARLQVDDDAQSSARYAAQQIVGSTPVNQALAEEAYRSAVAALPNKQETIVTVNSNNPKESFSVGQDRSVTLTVTRKAPTLVFKYLPHLKDFTTAKSTYTQDPIGF